MASCQKLETILKMDNGGSLKKTIVHKDLLLWEDRNTLYITQKERELGFASVEFSRDISKQELKKWLQQTSGERVQD